MPTATSANTAPPVGPAASQSLYLADLYDGAVLIYSAASSGATSPSAIIAGSNTGFTDSTGSSPIFGCAVDPSSGTVYVLTQTTDANGATIAETISAFPAGSTGNVAPSRTIALPTSIDAESLATANGSLYVTDDDGTGAIDVYAASASGAATATSTFSPSGGFTDTANAVSVDGSGNVYVSTYDETATASTEAMQAVYVFPPGANGTVAATTLTGSATDFGNGVLVASVADASGRIDAAVDDQTNDTIADVDEFAAGATGNTAPTTTFQDATSNGPVDLTTDASGDLYLSEIGTSQQYAQVNVFAPGATTPARTLQAYEAALPLVALGPYVAPDASGSMTVAHARRSAARTRRLPFALRRLRAAILR